MRAREDLEEIKDKLQELQLQILNVRNGEERRVLLCLPIADLLELVEDCKKNI